MMIKIQIPFALLVAILIVIFCSVPGVRSDSDSDSNTNTNTNTIRLHTEDEDVCGEWGGHRPRPASSCPVKCFRPDPVCGVDGVTYWCGCGDARCAGTKVAKKGFCEIGNNGAAAQALLLVHIIWLVVLGFSVVFGLF